MRNQYTHILKNFFRSKLIITRLHLPLTQEQMAQRLYMDDRSYIALEHGKSCCGAVTLSLFLIYCCDDPVMFLSELRETFEQESNYVA